MVSLTKVTATGIGTRVPAARARDAAMAAIMQKRSARRIRKSGVRCAAHGARILSLACTLVWHADRQVGVDLCGAAAMLLALTSAALSKYTPLNY